MIDADMFSYWSSANNATTGQVITLTLGSPSRLRGMRFLSALSGNAAAPSRLTVSSRDSGGTEIDVVDVVVPDDPMWKPIPLFVDSAVSEVQIAITEISPTGGNRIFVTGIELFGLP